MQHLFTTCAAVVLGWSSLWATSVAYSQSFPDRPVQLVVPFPPGGSGDTIGRIVSQGMSEALGKPVIVVNRPGAGGEVGTAIVARSAADGYSLLLASAGHTIQPLLRAVTWHPIKDFAPVGTVSTSPFVLAVNPSVATTTLQEFIAFAKANPGKLNYGSSGPGTGPHLGMEVLKSIARIDVVHVPYKGNAPMAAAVIAGEVQVVMDSMAVPLPLIQAGKLRGLAVTGATRSPLLPQLPTMRESGLSGMDFGAWVGILAPAGTPSDVVTRLNSAVNQAINSPMGRDRLSSIGFPPKSSTPEEFGAFMVSDTQMYAKVIKEAGIRAE